MIDELIDDEAQGQIPQSSFVNRQFTRVWDRTSRRVANLMIAQLRQALYRVGSDLRWTLSSIRAGHRYGRALKLENQGKYEEAYEAIGDALELLPDEAESATTAVAAVLSSAVVMTVSYSGIAEKLGRPEAAHDAIKRTIRLATPFEFDSVTRGYLDRLRTRL